MIQTKLAIDIGREYLESHKIKYILKSDGSILVGTTNPRFVNFFKTRIETSDFYNNYGWIGGVLVLCNNARVVMWKDVTYSSEPSLCFNQFNSSNSLSSHLKSL
jgi:hypothetical protein